MKRTNVGGIFALAVALLVPTLALRGWALDLLWAWYLEPAGAPAISFVQAIGVGLVASLLLLRSTQDETRTYSALWERTGQLWFGTLLILLIGWILS